MKIAFISTSRYPTEKAYGVTTRETAHAAQKLGHDVAIFAFMGGGGDERGNKITYISKSRLIPILFLLARIRLIGPIFFVIRSVMCGFTRNLCESIKDRDLIIVRDPYLLPGLWLKMRGRTFLLELHHVPSRIARLVISSLNFRNELRIAAITPRLQNILQAMLPIAEIRLLPMAVPEEFFSLTKKHEKQTYRNVIYVGKSSSSGVDSNLNYLLESMALCRRLNLDLKLHLIGIEAEAIKHLETLAFNLGLKKSDISIVGHLTHAEVLEHLLNAEIGVLPYTSNSYNNSRFPIKALEYAATGCLILASNNPAYLELFPKGTAIFFDPTDIKSFSKAISDLHAGKFLGQEILSTARAWSEEFTYEKRVVKAIANVSKIGTAKKG